MADEPDLCPLCGEDLNEVESVAMCRGCEIEVCERHLDEYGYCHACGEGDTDGFLVEEEGEGE